MGNTRKASGTRTAPAPLSFAQVAAKIRRPRRIVELVMDAEAAAEIDALAELLERTRARDEISGTDPLAPAVARRLQDAELRADDSRARFTVEAVPHPAYRKLIADHPATPEYLADAKSSGGEVWPFEPDTFAPALVHAQLIDPVPASAEEFDDFWESLSDGQLRQLWVAALAVQMQVTTVSPGSRAAAEILAELADQS